MKKKTSLLLSSLVNNESSLGRTGLGLFSFFSEREDYDVVMEVWKESQERFITPKMRAAMVAYDLAQKSPETIDAVIRKCDPYSATLHSRHARVNIPYVYYDRRVIDKRTLDDIKLHTTAIAVPSEFTRQRFIGFGMDADKVHTVPLAVDGSIFVPSQKDPTKKTFTFINYGEQSIRKGTDILLRAFAQEFKNSPDVKLKMIVSCTSPVPNPNEMVEQLGLTNVEVINSRLPEDELVKHIQDAECFVALTRDDSFGMCGLEAMACGIPVIATERTGYGQYVTESNGMFVPTYEVVHERWEREPDVNEGARVMREMVDTYFNDYQKWSALSIASRETANNHGWENVGESFDLLVKKYLYGN